MQVEEDEDDANFPTVQSRQSDTSSWKVAAVASSTRYFPVSQETQSDDESCFDESEAVSDRYFPDPQITHTLDPGEEA